ncbi:copper resistance protein CopC [Streptomyces sp. NPDC048297]|uniref:copper resistance CopC/CopD family protein n=1 Tax=Streptomyces sp. NPDC048297 TaxID=3365531 RepID=UPI0037218440
MPAAGLLALLLALLLGSAAPAFAHAAPRETDPGDGVVLQRAPRHVTLTFTESVGLPADSFRVYDPGNRRVRTGEPDHAPGRSDTVRVTLPAGLGTGTYTVAWRVVSADSHPVSGALTFSVGERTARPASPPGPAENGTTTRLYDIARYLSYLAAALLLGTAAFVAYCRPPSRSHLLPPLLQPPLLVLLRTGGSALLASTIAQFLLRGPYEEGVSPVRAFALSSLTRTATTRPGELLLVRLALLLLTAACALFLRRGRRRIPRRAVLAAGAILAVALSLTWSAAEHASAGLQVPLAIVSTSLHLLAAAAWLGGLPALLLTLRGTPPDPLAAPAQVVTRFSRLAFASVTVLVVTGVYQSWRGLGSWQALTGTSYGRVLLAKLAAVAVLLAAAAWSRRLTTGTAHHRPGHLRRSVLAEVAVGMVVLVLTTLLTSTVPGRTAAEAARSAAGTATGTGIPVASVTTIPFDVGTPGGHGKVQITLDPGRVGATSVQAVVYGPDGGLSSVPELRVTLTLPARRIGPLDTRITDRGGYWAADSFDLPMPGEWTMKATVRVSELDQVTVSRTVRVTR